MTLISDAYNRWKEHCRVVYEATSIVVVETPSARRQRINMLLKNYNEFCQYYFPHYTKAKNAKFQLEAANKIRANDNIFAVLEWPREHAKSVHAGVIIPLWLKAMGEMKGMVVVGKNETDACNLLSHLQAELEFNQRYIADFGPQQKLGSWEEGEFETMDMVMFKAYGRGQSPRGLRNREMRPNYCLVDDIDDDEIVQNPERVERTVDWILGSLYGALDIKHSRFIMVGNRIHPKSILAHVVGNTDDTKIRRSGIYHSFIQATTDGTFTGEPSWPENFTSDQLRQRFERMGYYLAMREYFHRPVIKGKIFKNEWIHWGKIPSLKDMDDIVAYFDPSYKPKTTNDFKAIKVWGKKGLHLFNIDAFVKQTSIPEAVRWLYDFHESLPESVIVDYFMEEVFLQDMFYEDFENEARVRGYFLPIRGDKRQKADKFARIQAISPLWERGLVTYNIARRNSSHMITGIEQTLAFQKGSAIHDDGPDADEGAIWILQRRSRIESFEPVIGRRINQKNGKMAFLTDDDYSLLVAPEDLDVVTQSTEANRELAETMAMEQMKGFLSQRYDTEAIFAAEDDERNPLIVMYMIDITLFHLHGHLPDRMGLEQRRIRYEDALKWLKDACYHKTINPDLPVPEDDDLSPLPISYGSETKKTYKY